MTQTVQVVNLKAVNLKVVNLLMVRYYESTKEDNYSHIMCIDGVG